MTCEIPSILGLHNSPQFKRGINKSWRTIVPKLIKLLPLIVLATSSCANNSPAWVSQCPTLPPRDKSTMQLEGVDFKSEMSNFLFDSPSEPKQSSSNTT